VLAVCGAEELDTDDPRYVEAFTGALMLVQVLRELTFIRKALSKAE
jgi:hypothetical protein